MTEDDCEQIARALQAQSGLDDRPNADPLRIARWAEVEVRPDPGCRPYTESGVIYYSPSASLDAIAYFVAHELGHVMLRRAGAKLERAHEERAASRIASALMLPARPCLRDLYANDWSLEAMRALWPLATSWVIARRVTELREDAAAACLHGRSGPRIRTVEIERSRMLERGRTVLLGQMREHAH